MSAAEDAPVLTPEQQAALKEWSTRVRQQAERRIPQKGNPPLSTRLAQHLDGALTSYPAEYRAGIVAAWLEGMDVPRTPIQHEALMVTLGFTYKPSEMRAYAKTRDNPKIPEADRQRAGVAFRMAEARQGIEGLYATALEGMQKLAVVDLTREYTGATKPLRNGGAAPIHRGLIGQVYDPSYAPPRVHKQSIPYTELYDHDLKNILATTQNPYEYLTAFRALRGANQTDTSESEWELGKHLPNRKSIEWLRTNLFARNPAEYERFQELVIRTTLAHYRTIAHVAHPMGEELPNAYWQAALERTNHPERWAAARNKPAWADQLLDVTFQGAYLRLVRYASGRSANDIAKAIGRSAAENIHSAETGSFLADPKYTSGNTLEALATYYSTDPYMRQFFDPAVFNRLPDMVGTPFARQLGLKEELRAVPREARNGKNGHANGHAPAVTAAAPAAPASAPAPTAPTATSRPAPATNGFSFAPLRPLNEKEQLWLGALRVWLQKHPSENFYVSNYQQQNLPFYQTDDVLKILDRFCNESGWPGGGATLLGALHLQQAHIERELGGLNLGYKLPQGAPANGPAWMPPPRIPAVQSPSATRLTEPPQPPRRVIR